MGAANTPEVLDPALMRPGRCDRQVIVDRPDMRGREAILRVHGADRLGHAGIDHAELERALAPAAA